MYYIFYKFEFRKKENKLEYILLKLYTFIWLDIFFWDN